MNVLLINSVCGIGSTGRICTDLAKQMEQEGDTVKIAYGRGEVSAQYEKYAVKIGGKWNAKLHALNTRLTDRHGLCSKRATKRFLQWAESFNPDLLWLHNIHGYYINIEMLFAWIKSRPQMQVRWTLHDCWAFTGHCSHFSFVGCDKWKTGCSSCPQKTRYPTSFLLDYSKGNYIRKKNAFTGVSNMTLIAPSKWLAELVGKSFLNEYLVDIIHTGIDLSVFKPTPSNFRQKYHCEDKFILLGVAFGWGIRKGMDVFIDLASRLDDRFQIVLVGTDDKIDSTLPPNIISIHRTQNQTELAEIYTSADLFVNPTREEVLGLVNIEALACGTPVVTFSTGGSPECIDSTCGSVVPCDDIDALEQEILRIAATNPYPASVCLVKSKIFDMNAKYKELIAYHI